MTNDAEPPAAPALVRDLVAAARVAQAWDTLEAVATAGYAAGVTKAALLRGCGAALDFIADGAPGGTDDPALRRRPGADGPPGGLLPGRRGDRAITPEVMAATPCSP
ncbi:hypothetical protein [Amycolatopsis sp. NPDC003861]